MVTVESDPEQVLVTAIEEFRARHGLSLHEMSIRLGLTKTTWALIRRGGRPVRFALLAGAVKIPELKAAVDAYLAAAPTGHRRRKAPEEGAGA